MRSAGRHPPPRAPCSTQTEGPPLLAWWSTPLVEVALATGLPEPLDDERAAPLLRPGMLGYRALRAADVPPGGRLGIYAFGVGAQLTAGARGEHNRAVAS